MDLNEELRVVDPWSIKGELTLSCNCEVFCPCVLSLGRHAPNIVHADAGRHPFRQQCSIDEPIGLRIAADDRCQ